ncbi:PREDICTED: plasminogen activator inhibitor 1 RNA-binding protein-like [Ipomoea nil]|uniref:plasminogen activator inhibitor 1 RNA-binding protein-like n=1 Tax=Ipomoea nil TaxID=35883 RepID=UPI0009018E7E|nr:PREDICTED: plasminogen activator inhibitor 1 RNA-binding protein-like [Ipomoea nil]
MADLNPFDLLGNDDTDDPSQLLAAQQQKVAPAKEALAQAAKQQGKLPSKPLPPAQAVREAKTEPARGGGRFGGGRGRGRGRGGSGFDREASNNDGGSFGNREFSGGFARPGEGGDLGRPSERRGGYGGPRGPFRGGGRRGGYSNGDVADGEQPRRAYYDRRNETGQGNVGGGWQGSWGAQADERTPLTEGVDEGEKNKNVEKPSNEEELSDANKENPATDTVEKKPEDKEMTLEEYEKVLEEKRKALQVLKTEERKVDGKVFESMQQISKKTSDDIFVKLGSEDKKRREFAEKTKKSVSINEFLKPAEGERYSGSGGRGRGRGRDRGGYSGGKTMSFMEAQAPSIEDPGQFPTLGGK